MPKPSVFGPTVLLYPGALSTVWFSTLNASAWKLSLKFSTSRKSLLRLALKSSMPEAGPLNTPYPALPRNSRVTNSR